MKPEEAWYRLAGAVLRQAILDAHPKSPQEDRLEAEAFVRKHFSHKPAEMRFIQRFWDGPLKYVNYVPRRSA